MTDGDVSRVDVSGARGVQVGDHNTQISYFSGQSPAAADLQALHPRAAARRIRGMQAEDAASLIAQLAVQPAVDLLEELLLHDERDARDEPVAVAVLTSMHPARAQELITRLAAAADWLADLPRAAAAIRKAHDDARAGLGDESGPITRIEGGPPAGFRLACAGGFVCWRPGTGAVAVSGSIHSYYQATGGDAGLLGFPLESLRDGVQRFERADVHQYNWNAQIIPVSDAIRTVWCASDGAIGHPATLERAAGPSPSGAVGSVQLFQDAISTHLEVLVYTSVRFGTVALFEPTLSLYYELDGPAGWLGFPVAHTVGADGVQLFEGGVIVRRPDHRDGVLAVPLLIYTAAQDMLLGLPTGPAQRLGDGPDQVQFFDEGLVTVRDGIAEAWTRKQTPGFFESYK